MTQPALPISEQLRLQVLRSHYLLDTPAETAYNDLVQLAAHLCQVPMAVINLIDEHRQWSKAAAGLERFESPRNISFCTHVVDGDAPLVVPDTHQDARFADNPFVVGPPHLRFYAGLPLRSPLGVTLGTLAVFDRVPRTLTAEQMTLLEALARQVMAQLELRFERIHHRLTALRLAVAQRFSQMNTWQFYIDENRLLWTEGIYHLTGLSADRFDETLEAFVALVHPGDRDAVTAALIQAVQGQPLDLEHRLVRPDGEVRQVRLQGQSFAGDSAFAPLLVGTLQDLTAVKQAQAQQQAQQQALRYAHDTLSFHINNSPLAVVEWDWAFRVSHWSPQAAALFGWSEAEVRGQHPGDWPFVYPDDAPAVEQVMAQLLYGETWRNVSRNRNLTRDGAVVHCEWYNSARLDDDGNLVSIFSLVLDVTERVQAEQAIAAGLAREQAAGATLRLRSRELQQANQQLQESRTLARIGGRLGRLGGWAADIGHNQVYWSEEIFHILDWSNDNVPPLEDSLDLYTPEHRERVSAALAACAQAGTPFDLELELYTATGRRFWARAIGEAERNADGDIVRVIGAFQDISAQKQAESALERFATRLRTTLESMTDAFYLLDDQWRFTYLNTEAERVLLRQPGELIGRVVWETFPEAQESQIYSEYHQAVRDNQSRHFETYYEPLHEWFDVNAYPSPDGLAVYFRVISDRIALEDRLRQSQRLESLGQLTGGVAHDFNNLLTVIMGNAELLAETLTPDSALRPLAEMVSSAAQRGAELTQRLLAFARRQALDPKPVDVNQLIATMTDLMCRTLGEHIEVVRLPADDLWPALVDPAQLENALLNLCLNARDAMAPGGELTLETSNVYLDQDYADQHGEAQPGEYVLVAVSDNGVGIAPDHLPHVFEPFFTTKETGKGTGLGLSMAYGFAKQSNGHITIYSELGHGTTIRLYLPRYFGNQEDVPENIVMTASASGQENILLVEDDDLVRSYVQNQLEQLGYRVTVASSGPIALEIIQQQAEIDLLFTDVIMPGGMSGRELADAARRLRPDLKILYTSGYSEQAIVHHGRLDPGVKLLSKPYRRADLAQKLRDVLDEEA
ncbi:PAS domain S-box protein [Leptolyngbya sp. CCNP1308]|uniref:PAS domain S-box protein n=1 Tax=Leptolyngbya sp. CCNP1308 TaxID=3110255 RepID=UPI002B20B6C2|nr:PAS domain S-box protein [Leptolyngbya sp. CCNP1308]MEA5451611.1 PAS domain S-box protein [Leptolyngbya sp. CCNP1308]